MRPQVVRSPGRPHENHSTDGGATHPARSVPLVLSALRLVTHFQPCRHRRRVAQSRTRICRVHHSSIFLSVFEYNYFSAVYRHIERLPTNGNVYNQRQMIRTHIRADPTIVHLDVGRDQAVVDRYAQRRHPGRPAGLNSKTLPTVTKF